TNRIKTSKYNVVTFLPVNLFEQFQRVANAYFLFLLILQLIPQISSLSWFTTIVPLVLVLTITAVKDASEEYFRHRSDNQVNNRQSQVHINGKLQNEKWMNVRVGDIIKMENNQFVAADLLLLSSSEPHSLCYIETAELDGETNLKVRQALPVTSQIADDIDKLAHFDGEVICEPPNNKLDRFTGTLYWRGNTYSLDNDKMLLRGCVLRNTEWCYGLVVFAGPDTKLMQNSGRTKLKRTSIDRLMNTLVLWWIFGFLVCMGSILGLGNTIWESAIGYYFQPYLPWESAVDSAIFSGFLTFWSYIIILNTVVPISLYVSVEVIRLGHSYFINWDRKMYYGKRDTPAEVRTTTLNEELGQIEYIFSDKTGTLTQNIMTFNKCSINGRVYGGAYDVTGHKVEINERSVPVDFSRNLLADRRFLFYDQTMLEAIRLGEWGVHEFFRLLALCHTVMPEEKTEGELAYQAQSPDEGALVTAARNFDFVFRSRTPETITLHELGEPRTYQLLAILDFNNFRKRMSVIVRNAEGRLKLYCKGADSVIFERLHPCNQQLVNITADHLSAFAGEGLRTLCLAYRDLDEASFEEWQERHHEANTSLQGREELLAAVYDEIEQNMMLLGATAIEDKLQEGVPETIAKLALANIKIWVLTGDKQAATRAAFYRSSLISIVRKNVHLILMSSLLTVLCFIHPINERSVEPLHGVFISSTLGRLHKMAVVVMVVVIVADCAGRVCNGVNLAVRLGAVLKDDFLAAVASNHSSVALRLTANSESENTRFVAKQWIGLNDGRPSHNCIVIETAHIGVGISGQEGMQAVLSSDYSFAQFRFLQRLLLVHGRWSYLRMCKFLCYFFYKNFAFTLVHFWFGFFCGFSAQTVYDQWFITLFNIVYTSLPVLAMGVFDQDINDQWSIDCPKLYEPGQLNLLFNKREFFICIGQGIYTSVVLFFVPYAAFVEAVRDDGTGLSDHQSLAVAVSTSLIIVVSLQMGLDTAYWTAINHFFIWGSVAVYFAIMFAMYSAGLYSIFPSQFRFIGTARNTLNQPSVWLVIALTTIVCIMPIAAFRFLKTDLRPTLSDKTQERYMQRQRRKQKPQTLRLHRVHRTGSRRSGYAFAHQEGFGELITSGKNMRGFHSATALLTRAAHGSASWFESLGKRRAGDPTSQQQPKVGG
uniref:Phospholipid-transporting ATPase n=1 Tax=Petromyzon marinus TaxID=7757 RepID=S4RDT0_PETMA